MSWVVFASILLSIGLILKRDVWNKVLGLSSLNLKVAVISAVIAYTSGERALIDVSLMYLMASGAGTVLILIFLMRSGVE